MTDLNTLRAAWRGGLGAQEDRRLLLRCLLFTFLWGLLAHAYAFLHDSFSHDILNALYADGTEVFWKMQLGRFGTVLYRRLVRVPLALPWLLGMLSLGWLSLAVYLTAKLLRLETTLALCLTAGLFTVNLSTIAMAATYLYEMDMDMLALLAALGAVFLWARFGWTGTLLGALLLTGSLSLYQSFLSAALVGVMLLCLARLFAGRRFGEVLTAGLRSLAMFALGGGLYYALLRLMVRLKEIPLDTGTNNSVYQVFEAEGTRLWERLGAVYGDVGAAFFDPARSHLSRAALVCNLLLAALTLLLALRFFLRRERGWAEKLLALALLALLPLGANVSRLFGARESHDLMKYAFWLLYLLPLLLLKTQELRRLARPARLLAALLALLLLWDGVQTANAVYVKKDLEQDATLSLMTRVLGRLESEPGYVPGETELVFVGAGDVLGESVYGFERYGDITGAEYPSAIPHSHNTYYYNAYTAYFRYVLNTRVKMAGFWQWVSLQYDPRVTEMPSYPAEGFIRDIDGIWVVKLGVPMRETGGTP